MIRRITVLLVFLTAVTFGQWGRPNQQNVWENQGNQLNQNNRQWGNQQQGSISWNNEEEQSEFQRPWNRPGNDNRPGFNQNRPGTNQNRPGTNQNRPGTNQNRPGINQNRPGTNQNRPWQSSTTSTTSRSTTRGRQQSTTSRSTASGSSTPSDFSTTASPAFTSCMTMCRTTPEYNPVCGSDARTYNNEQRLNCAVSCGLSKYYLADNTQVFQVRGTTTCFGGTGPI